MDRRLNRTPDPPLPPCRMIKTGPNDASGVVWATGMYFFFYNRVLLILTNFFTLSRLYLPHNNTGKVGLCCGDQNGPIWRRLGHRYVFLFCNRVLWILTNFSTVFRLYLPHNSTGKVRLCCDDQNGPKRCQMRRLGHRYVFLFCNRFLWILPNFFTVFRLYLPYNTMVKGGLCCDNQIGPK
jgi:hypothetical protein